jgi:hypothetical protein
MIFIVAVTPALSTPVPAQLENLDKDHQALIERGLQIRGRNLGPALVLKDVLFIPGQHKDGSGKIVDNSAPMGVRSYPSGFFRAVKDPWIRGVHSIANRGSKNDGLSGDALLAWFQVGDESLDGPNHSDEWYFMVANALVEPSGSAGDTLQNIQLNFVNGVAKQVQRLNRDTGQVDAIDLELIPHTGGRRRLIVNLDGGTAQLFKFNTGAPFVGAARPEEHHDRKIDPAVVKTGSGRQPSLSWAIVLLAMAVGLWLSLLPVRRTYDVKERKER